MRVARAPERDRLRDPILPADEHLARSSTRLPGCTKSDVPGGRQLQVHVSLARDDRDRCREPQWSTEAPLENVGRERERTLLSGEIGVDDECTLAVWVDAMQLDPPIVGLLSPQDHADQCSRSTVRTQ